MRRLLKRITPLLAICLIISCGDSSTGPDNNSGSGGDNSGSDGSGSSTGTVEITTSTSGNQQDSDGYTVTIGSSEESISANGTVSVKMDEGSYDAELSGIAENCSTDGDNPKTVDVTAGETTSKTFSISCQANTGSVEVTTSTSGENQDSNGYTFTFADRDTSIGINETITMSGFEEGSYEAQLSGLAENCSVVGENPRSDNIQAGITIAMTFEVSCEKPGQNKIVYGLAKMDPDGSNKEVILERDGAESYPEISNDGSKIAFVDDATSTEKIYILDSDGTNIREVEISDIILNFVGNLSWSPDDSQLVFHSTRVSDGDELYIVDINTGETTRLTDNSFNDVSPDWSPNGEKIIYSSAENYGSNNLYIYHVDNGNIEQLTSGMSEDLDPSWSPDGTKIAFNRDGEGIYTMDADGSNPEKITDYGSERSISWSPDGSQILFIETYQDQYGGYEKLFKITSDGSGQKTEILRIESAYSLTEPDWGVLKPPMN